MYPNEEGIVQAWPVEDQQPENAVQPTQQTITRTTVELLVEYARQINPDGWCASLPFTEDIGKIIGPGEWIDEENLAGIIEEWAYLKGKKTV